MKLNNKKIGLRLLIKGGVLSPSHLLTIIKIAEKAGNQHISFGSRQDILIDLPDKNEAQICKLLDAEKIDYISTNSTSEHRPQNIVSSYVSSNIQESTPWLNSGNYTQILNQFTYAHKLRINIADPMQSLVPLFYGHLNFVASHHKHYWYLYLRMPKSKENFEWPMLVYSTDIPTLSEQIETLWFQNPYIKNEDLAQSLLSTAVLNHKKIDTPLVYTKSFSSDYEGFGRMNESNNHWAGLYWRNNMYDIPFLEVMCLLCIKNGYSSIAITPWKSFIIKDIKGPELTTWLALLGRFGITMRHSAFELNWHLPLGDNSALKLKRRIVNQFDKKDVCVHGLTFGISNDIEKPFCSIIIKERLGSLLTKWTGIGKKYDIWIAKNFDPNSCVYNLWESNLSPSQIPHTLHNATQTYYKQFIPKYTKTPLSTTNKTEKQLVYQCPNCLTAYLPEIGDASSNIQPGTPFKTLPQNYCCPLCNTSKDTFIMVDLSKLIIS